MSLGELSAGGVGGDGATLDAALGIARSETAATLRREMGAAYVATLSFADSNGTAASSTAASERGANASSSAAAASSGGCVYVTDDRLGTLERSCSDATTTARTTTAAAAATDGDDGALEAVLAAGALQEARGIDAVPSRHELIGASYEPHTTPPQSRLYRVKLDNNGSSSSSGSGGDDDGASESSYASYELLEIGAAGSSFEGVAAISFHRTVVVDRGAQVAIASEQPSQR